MLKSNRFNVCPAIPLIALISLLGCASQDSVEKLDNRIQTLEAKQKSIEEKQRAKEDSEKQRQDQLENCVKVDADDEYWSYVRLNGKSVPGKPGVYTMPTYQWDQADKRKRSKIEECKLLYGSH